MIPLINRDLDFLFNLVIQMIKDDPERLNDARVETDALIGMGAQMSATPEAILAESCIYRLKEQNPHIPELIDAINAVDDELNDKLEAHFIETKAYLCTEYYLNGSCIHSEHTV